MSTMRSQRHVVVLGLSLILYSACGFTAQTTTSTFSLFGTRTRTTSDPPLLTSALSTIRYRSPLASSSTQTTQEVEEIALTDHQVDFICGYLNKHHADVLQKFALEFSELGQVRRQKNAWSGDSYNITGAELQAIDLHKLTLGVTIQERNKEPYVEVVELDLDAQLLRSSSSSSSSSSNQKTMMIPPLSRTFIPTVQQSTFSPIDDVIRRLIRLCNLVEEYSATGKLIQLGWQLDGTGVGKLHDNLYLNQVPHNKYVRQYFYDLCSTAVLDAVNLYYSDSDDAMDHNNPRMKVVWTFPELNPSMDSYRIGTLLELVRSISLRLVQGGGKRVRVCVQGSMGVGIFTGTPKSLSGVAKLLQLMDWQNEEGEANEGILGDKIRFGGIGKEHVINDHTVQNEDGSTTDIAGDNVFICIAPQSMVGTDTSIIQPLQEMVQAAGDRPVILINPDLVDKVSAAGQQNVRGRQERMDFANTFQTISQFTNTYTSGTSYFPILGAISKLGPLLPYVAYQRRDLVNNDGEVYLPICSSEELPTSEIMKQALDL